MAATIVTLADAVVAELESHEFTVSLAPVRTYVPKFDLTSGVDLQTKVVPKADAREPATRETDACDMIIDVGLMRKLQGTPAEEQAAVDELMSVAEEVKEFLIRRRPADCPEAVCTATKNDPLYNVDELDGGRVFLTVIAATFAVER